MDFSGRTKLLCKACITNPSLQYSGMTAGSMIRSSLCSTIRECSCSSRIFLSPALEFWHCTQYRLVHPNPESQHVHLRALHTNCQAFLEETTNFSHFLSSKAWEPGTATTSMAWLWCISMLQLFSLPPEHIQSSSSWLSQAILQPFLFLLLPCPILLPLGHKACRPPNTTSMNSLVFSGQSIVRILFPLVLSQYSIAKLSKPHGARPHRPQALLERHANHLLPCKWKEAAMEWKMKPFWKWLFTDPLHCSYQAPSFLSPPPAIPTQSSPAATGTFVVSHLIVFR